MNYYPFNTFRKSVFAHINFVFVVSPAVIVGISMGATKLDGYGNSQ